MRLSLVSFLERNKEEILQEWENTEHKRFQRQAVGKEIFRGHAREMLEAIAAGVNGGESAGAGEHRPGKGSGYRDLHHYARLHARQRVQSDVGIDQVVAEFASLRAVVLRRWTRETGASHQPHLDELTAFNALLDNAMQVTVHACISEAEQTRDLFLGALGHDMSNPLGAIEASAQLLQLEGKLDDSQWSAVERIKKSVANCLDIIADLRDMTRMRLGGELPLHCVPADMEEICRQVSRELEGHYPQCDVRLDCRGDLRGKWDQGRIYRLISNLVANALRYGERRKPITVRAHADGHEVRIQVHNHGPSIPQAERANIFVPMRRIEGFGHHGQGLGLGLYIARAFTEAHGGGIDLESSDAAGTTFTVRLPRHCEDGASLSARPEVNAGNSIDRPAI